MNYLSCKSYAKLNLCLHIINKRKDGYHNIESIFHTIDLYDSITFRINDKRSINFTCDSELIKPSENLVIEAYKKMSKKYDEVKGLDINLKKNIPIGSGLGGGSSNAAVTLLAINRLFNLNLTSAELKKISESIGSDVPFFLQGGTSHVQGRGEIVKNIPYKNKYFVLVFSDLHISTKEIYDEISQSDYVPKKNCSELISSVKNSLEKTVMDKYPQLMDTKYWLSAFGSVRMSGTGSVLFITFDDYDKAQEANKKIGKKHKAIMVSSLKSYDIYS